MDSCNVPGAIHFCKSDLPESLDTCEGGRFSCYIGADMIAEAERIRREKEEQERKKAEAEALRAERRSNNLCQHCGGEFKKVLFGMKCTACEKKKDYK